AMNGKDEGGPSANQLRKRLGFWFRGELRAVVGPIPPSEPDFPARLQELGKLSAHLASQIPERTKQIVQELIAEQSEHVPDEDGIEPLGEAGSV
ncbi:MAG: hypothetical protein IT336_09695, partial [Thermomicrobiales bacterium]|nr:hypothetical protein [Thermomicrobiales bacterium]